MLYAAERWHTHRERSEEGRGGPMGIEMQKTKPVAQHRHPQRASGEFW